MDKAIQSKKIGILGGTGWPSTVLYYSELCRRSEALGLVVNESKVPTTPEMSVESLDLRHAVSLIPKIDEESGWEQFDEYHKAALLRLKASGADFALMASNTPHHRFASIVDGVGIPVIDMFEAVAQYCASYGHKKVLILGTALTMRSQVLRSAFDAQSIEAASPENPSDRTEVLSIISDLQRGNVGGMDSRINELVRSVSNCQFDGLPTVCLGCTELPMAFAASQGQSSFEDHGVQYVNTAAVHLEVALKMAYENS